MDIFDLMATIRLDASEYEQGLQDAEDKASSFGSGIGSKLGKAAAVGGVAIGAVAAGASAAGAAFVKGAGDVASYGDDIDKMSQKLGLSAEAYQEWDAVLQHSGTSVSALRSSMKTLQQQSEKNADAFEKIGISEQQLASMSREELFSATITGLQNMTDEGEKAALAQKLLGRGAMELGALLNTSAEETEAMKQKVHELGGVMSDDAVKGAARFQDSLQDMNTAVDGVRRSLMSEFLPSFADVMDGISELFSGDSEEGLGMISEGIDGIVDGIAEKLPRVIEIGGNIIGSIIKGITENLPKIIQSSTGVIMTLVQGLIASLPNILSAGMQAIIELANGIGQALPQLIPAAVDAILTFATALLDNLPQIIEAALQLMIGLAEGLVEAIPVVIERLPEIISAIVDALVKSAPKIAEAGVKLLTSLVTNLPRIIADIVAAVPQIISGIVGAVGDGVGQMVEAGKNLMLGLVDGIKQKASAVWEAAKGVGSRVISFVNGIFGNNSPSKEFKKIGAYLMQGLAIGIDDNVGVVEDSLDDLGDLMDDFDNDLSTFGSTVSVVTPDGVDSASGRNTGSRTEMLLQDILGALQGMGVNIDGRALVGSIGQRMNQEFGYMEYYANREVWV